MRLRATWVWAAILMLACGSATAQSKDAVDVGAVSDSAWGAQLHAGLTTDLDPDPAFTNHGHGPGQASYYLDYPNATGGQGLRVYPMGGAGWYLLARHLREDGGWDAAVIRVRPNGLEDGVFLVPTPLRSLSDAVMDPVSRKFYFVGEGHNPILPGNDGDFAVTCVDIDTVSGGSTCAGFGSDGTAWVPFNLGGSNSEWAQRVVVRPNIGLLLAGTACGSSNCVLAVTSLYPASGAVFTAFGSNGRYTLPLGSAEFTVDDMALSSGEGAQTRAYIAGAYAATAHNVDGYVLALKAIEGVADTGFNGNGLRPVAHNTGPCAPDCPVDRVSAITVQANGKLALAGTTELGTTRPAMLGRLDVDGSFDAGFRSAGLYSLDADWPGPGVTFPWAIAERPDTRDLVVAMSYGGTVVFDERARTGSDFDALCHGSEARWLPAFVGRMGSRACAGRQPTESITGGAPVRQFIGQWSASGRTLHAGSSFQFDAFDPSDSLAEPRGLLVDADSAMMVGIRWWEAGDWDATLVRTLANDTIFACQFGGSDSD